MDKITRQRISKFGLQGISQTLQGWHETWC